MYNQLFLLLLLENMKNNKKLFKMYTFNNCAQIIILSQSLLFGLLRSYFLYKEEAESHVRSDLIHDVVHQAKVSRHILKEEADVHHLCHLRVDHLEVVDADTDEEKEWFGKNPIKLRTIFTENYQYFSDFTVSG